MKKIVIYIFFLISSYAQSDPDTLIYSAGKKNTGKFIEFTGKQVIFVFKGYTKNIKVNIESLDSLIIGDCCYLDFNTGEIVNPLKLAKLKEEKERKEKEECESNNQIKFIILPFNNDKYARTKEFIDDFRSECYDVIPNYFALEYLNKNNILLNEITDYEIINMAKTLKVDNIVFGDLYLIEKPYKYAPGADQSMSQQDLMRAGRALRGEPSLFDAVGDKSRNQAEQDEQDLRLLATISAGTYLYETIYVLNQNKKERSYIRKNKLVMRW